jgi:RNA polymerase sigma factor (sigma-70 family)
MSAIVALARDPVEPGPVATASYPVMTGHDPDTEFAAYAAAAWATVRAADNRDAYVYRVLVNCLRDSRRRRWWGEHATADLPEPRGHGGARDQIADVDTADAIHRAMAGLSKVNRDVVVLRYLAQLTEQQTAEVLGVPAGTVKSRLSRALRSLASDRHLADLDDGVGDRLSEERAP